MKKILFALVILFLFVCCKTQKVNKSVSQSLIDVMNKEIIDGFYDGDSLKAVRNNAYFIKSIDKKTCTEEVLKYKIQ